MHPEIAKSLWNGATKRIEWLEKELKEIEKELCNSKHCKLCEKVKNIMIKYSDGEPTTADEHNKIYMSDINKEIVDEAQDEADKKELTNMLDDKEGYLNEDTMQEDEKLVFKEQFGGDTGIDADYYDENSEKFLKVSK